MRSALDGRLVGVNITLPAIGGEDGTSTGPPTQIPPGRRAELRSAIATDLLARVPS